MSAARYLRQVVTRLHATLGYELVGVYAGGSFALGAYVRPRSDLDVAAVCRLPLAPERKTEVADAVRHESLPCPARKLELVLYREEIVREPTAEAGYELDLNTGRGCFRLSVDPVESAWHWYVIDRAILRAHGKALHGPPPRELYAPIARETLLLALSESVRWHTVAADARLDDAVLNGCRAWRFAAEGVWSSKPDGGEWAILRLPEPDLVAKALAARSGDATLDAGRVASFLDRVRRYLAESHS